jgi:hypothetical protein
VKVGEERLENINCKMKNGGGSFGESENMEHVTVDLSSWRNTGIFLGRGESEK